MSGGGGGKAGGLGVNVQSLGIGFTVQGSKQPVSSLDFHREGEFLVSGAEDGKRVYVRCGYWTVLPIPPSTETLDPTGRRL